MLISYKWLQSYFDEKLPEPEKLAERITFSFAEIESVESNESGDTIFDLKILADRACYALSHRGVAYEVSAMFGNRLVFKEVGTVQSVEKTDLKIEIKKPDLCPRYIGRLVKNVKVGPSPEWLKEKLEAIGERSINNIVDIANYVMFDVGQPLHAFDADKVKGEIVVRLAKKEEVITTLDGKELKLDSDVLVIADDAGPLAVAGVKGGNRAEVTLSTTRLILESANFDKTSIRRTETRLGLPTAAAKRFEAGITPELALEAMERFSTMIKDSVPGVAFEERVDVYKRKQKTGRVVVSAKFISDVLGREIHESEITLLLYRLWIDVKKTRGKLDLAIPNWRLDLNIPEDIVEEVGRLYGYEKIEGAVPQPLRYKPISHKEFYYIEKIKNLLVSQGYSEVSLSTLGAKGYVETEHPLASDKKFLRENLLTGLTESLEKNLKIAPVLGINEVKIFEIGRIFTRQGEKTSIAIASALLGKTKGRTNETAMNEIIGLLSTAFGVALNAKVVSASNGALCEVDLTDIIPRLKPCGYYEELSFESAPAKKFKLFSQYPFIIRDVAVFVPMGIKSDDVYGLILKEAGELVVNSWLFDTFEKNGSISYAFRLVFQSLEKTLTDEEANEIMTAVTGALQKNRGWQVR